MVLQHSILWQLGRYEEAGKTMDALTAFVNESSQYFLPNLTAYRTKWKLLDGDKNAAREWLDRCEAGAILAALYWTQNRKKEAEAELTETLEVLQPYGFVRVVADEGEAVVPVLKRVLSSWHRIKSDHMFINRLQFLQKTFTQYTCFLHYFPI